MVVTVLNKGTEPAKPVAGVRVTLSYFDGSQKITDARDRTNRKGQTELLVSQEARERGDLRIDISDANGLVVYQPLEGLLTAIPRTVVVTLLPKGAPALLEPARIEAMLDRLSRQNQQLKASLSVAANRRPSFDQDLNNWATSNGVSYEEADGLVRAWAEDVLAHREAASLNKQGEAELALRHFEEAAKLFEMRAGWHCTGNKRNFWLSSTGNFARFSS